jgi:hypothetical protein
MHVLENAAGKLTYVFELVHTVGEAWQEGYEAGRRSVAAREEVER